MVKVSNFFSFFFRGDDSDGIMAIKRRFVILCTVLFVGRFIDIFTS